MNTLTGQKVVVVAFVIGLSSLIGRVLYISGVFCPVIAVNHVWWPDAGKGRIDVTIMRHGDKVYEDDCTYIAGTCDSVETVHLAMADQFIKSHAK